MGGCMWTGYERKNFMMGFNFLPWREERRTQKKAAFNQLVLLQITLGLGIVAIVWMSNEKKLEVQYGKNTYLQSEIKILDKKITEIDNLHHEIDKLQAHQRAVEKLQTNRNRPVDLLSLLTEQVPAGVMLKSLKQGDQIILSGYALSNARVSEFMHNLSQTPNRLGLGQPELIEIKSASYGAGKETRKLFDFTLALPVIPD
jgi:type IV pilus assembly protein PilN